jgi:hypothetical protein
MRWPVAVALLCAACAAPAPVATNAVCPTVDNYTPAENAQIATELAALSKGDVLIKVADEDHRLRAELQACRN